MTTSCTAASSHTSRERLTDVFSNEVSTHVCGLTRRTEVTIRVVNIFQIAVRLRNTSKARANERTSVTPSAKPSDAKNFRVRKRSPRNEELEQTIDSEDCRIKAKQNRAMKQKKRKLPSPS